MMPYVVITIILILWLYFNGVASILILRDTLSEKKQKLLQLLVVWVIPFAGAFLVLWVHRSTDKFTGKYQEETVASDGLGDGFRANIFDVVDGD